MHDVLYLEGNARKLANNLTEKASYGPPYHNEYGGSLPEECNRINADLLCVLVTSFRLLRFYNIIFLCLQSYTLESLVGSVAWLC